MQSAENRLIRLPEVKNRVGLGKTKIYDLVNKGEFPKPKKVGRASLWPSVSIEKWMEQQSSQ